MEVTVEGRHLKLSNLDKVLWPAAGFTKGQMVDYYTRVAAVMVPHVVGRAITRTRWPDGVDGPHFYEKACPSYAPDWVPRVEMGDVTYCGVDSTAALVWLANLAAIEIHPTLAGAPDLDRPRSVVFDLDPGAPADVVTCARVALLLRDVLDRLGLQAWVKTSGSKGLQLYVPLNTPVGYDATRGFSNALARLLERSHPDLVVTSQEKRLRPGKVLIDWSQNTASKTTVAVYSLRAREAPTCSTPVTWDEVDHAASTGDGGGLRFEAAAVLDRVERLGDLMAPVLTVEQELPAL
ncbi:MAG TPA: non-homologous end-joining DNA ligase [Acidimicrobiales bacterium]|nr:non-homologous end-joining DNA ligase [Acidimicrobiales bacterium]